MDNIWFCAITCVNKDIYIFFLCLCLPSVDFVGVL